MFNKREVSKENRLPRVLTDQEIDAVSGGVAFGSAEILIQGEKFVFPNVPGGFEVPFSVFAHSRVIQSTI